MATTSPRDVESYLPEVYEATEGRGLEMTKDLAYYISLNYAVEIRRLPDGSYEACIPLLGRHAFVVNEDTVPEVWDQAHIHKREIIKGWLASGVEIPEPEEEEDKDDTARG